MVDATTDLGRPMRRRGPRRHLVAAVIAIAALLAGCGGGGDDSAESEAGGESSSTTAAANENPAPGEDPGKVLALGEEYLLADLLGIGIKPVASSVNVVLDDGFVGLEDEDTEGITPLPSTEPNLELLISFGADVVVANNFVRDRLGDSTLAKLGDEVIVVSDDEETRLKELGEAFDREDEAAALQKELDDAIAEGKAELDADGEPLSVATVYAGKNVAAWVDGPVEAPQTLLDLGYTLQPRADTPGPSGPTEGRVYLSNEQIGLLSAPRMVLLQTDAVDGEQEALDDIADDRVWAGLPAVESGNVIEIDRLGYPGTPGRIRIVADLVDKLGEE